MGRRPRVDLEVGSMTEELAQQHLEFTFPAVGIMRSCYKAKFGIPRQPGLVEEAKGAIELIPPYNQPNAVRGLEDFSHIWVMFVFHLAIREGWKATVRPPRLGGDKRIGVFASRSPFRPSPIGLSVLKLDRIVQGDHGKLVIEVTGQDILDGTPILDIKPYLPYTDSIPDAIGGFAPTPPNAEALKVIVSPKAERDFDEIGRRGNLSFRDLAIKVIAADPRPAYQREAGRVYGVFLDGYEVVWRAGGDCAEIIGIEKAKNVKKES